MENVKEVKSQKSKVKKSEDTCLGNRRFLAVNERRRKQRAKGKGSKSKSKEQEGEG